jgi:hypothetical protein
MQYFPELAGVIHRADDGDRMRPHLVDSSEVQETTGYLHREIMNPPHGCEVIFLNGDTLDCRKSNLKVVPRGESRRHNRVRKDSRTGVKGLRFDSFTGRWYAAFSRRGKSYYVGSFPTQEQARAAYRQAVKEFDGWMDGTGNWPDA